jgi:hypothetical protein
MKRGVTGVITVGVVIIAVAFTLLLNLVIFSAQNPSAVSISSALTETQQEPPCSYKPYDSSDLANFLNGMNIAICQSQQAAGGAGAILGLLTYTFSNPYLLVINAVTWILVGVWVYKAVIPTA